MRVFFFALSANTFTQKANEALLKFLWKSLGSSALRTDHLADCFTCCFAERGSLDFPNIFQIAPHNSNFFLHTFIYKPLCKRGREEPCLGKQRKRKHVETQYHHLKKEKKMFTSYSKEQKSHSQTLKVPFWSQEGPNSQNSSLYDKCLNYYRYRKQNSDQPAPETFHHHFCGPTHRVSRHNVATGEVHSGNSTVSSSRHIQDSYTGADLVIWGLKINAVLLFFFTLSLTQQKKYLKLFSCIQIFT